MDSFECKPRECARCDIEAPFAELCPDVANTQIDPGAPLLAKVATHLLEESQRQSREADRLAAASGAGPVLHITYEDMKAAHGAPRPCRRSCKNEKALNELRKRGIRSSAISLRASQSCIQAL